jgi:hypothetical protein
LDHIQTDYQKRLDQSIKGTLIDCFEFLTQSKGFEAFKLLDKQKNLHSMDGSRPLLQSTVSVFQFVEELFVDTITMSSYTSRFVEIIERILTSYIEICQQKYDEILTETETGKRLGNKEIVQLLSTDPLWKSTKATQTKFQLVSSFDNSNEPKLNSSSPSLNSNVGYFHND